MTPTNQAQRGANICHNLLWVRGKEESRGQKVHYGSKTEFNYNQMSEEEIVSEPSAAQAYCFRVT